MGLNLRQRFQFILFRLFSSIFRASPVIIIIVIIYYLWKMSDLLRAFYHLNILFMCCSIELFIHKKFGIILSLIFYINISTIASFRPFLNPKIFGRKNSIDRHDFLPPFSRVVIVGSYQFLNIDFISSCLYIL
jgi:hypothetical protein